MQGSSYLKNMLLGFLPLLLFVAADEFLSAHYPEDVATRYALILAMVFGIGEALYIYIREKRLDKMVLLDTFLILMMGGFSLLSGDEIFFKLKPAIIQLVSVVFLGVLAFLKPKALVAMSQRFLKGQQPMSDEQLASLQTSAKALTALLFIHSLLIVYAALYLSKGVWAFISGPFLYILAGLFFVCQFGYAWLRARRP